ncbi:hypothetical protein BJX66DRAFT_321654 [Aspergillus keveii]|uniref:FAD-binding domain-containing protein n=1 Tax=Aspergillus keveii TaxID=714993 RepID=A0ABR4GM78_9EURO
MDAPHAYETTDVVICGCGPTGALLSAYLGRMGVKNIVLEKESGITTDPRGIALDEDGIRLIQGIGIYEHIYREIGTCMQMFKFIGGTGKDLHRKGFVEMDYATTEGGTGHVGFICHQQPLLEKHLRLKMEASEHCDLRSTCTVMDITQDDEWTYCQYRDADGEDHNLRSRYLVGADGKTGFTRKNYLEPLGIRMEQAHQAFYDETWVALNWHIELPTEKTHPEFPLWALGYTPQDVYDLFFPVNFRFLCNPKRPSVCGRFGLPSDRLWRFEFVVQPGEDGDEMATYTKTRDVILPYLTHPGKRYGLVSDVQYPEDCIRVLRSRPFRFAARSCNKWSYGRVILCGDSAHVFPPFGGQGIASGFRDAAALAWRLAFLCNPTTPSTTNALTGTNRVHARVLEAWYMERKQQLEKSLASTIENGKFVTEANPFKIFLRTCYLFIMNLVPKWRHELHLGRRKEGLVRYQYSPGMPFVPELNGGLALPQVYCKSTTIVSGGGTAGVFFTDDVLFSSNKTGLFQLLVYLERGSELVAARRTVASMQAVAGGEICLEEATYIVEDMENSHSPSGEDEQDSLASVYQLATADEFAASPLCEGRPEPRNYDAHYLKKALRRARYVIVRPDRFIFAACKTAHELERGLAAAGEYFRS